MCRFNEACAAPKAICRWQFSTFSNPLANRSWARTPPPPPSLTAWHCRNLRNRKLLSFFTYVQASKSAPLWGRFSSIKRLIRAGSRRSLYHLIHKNIFIKIFAPYKFWNFGLDSRITVKIMVIIVWMPFLVRSDGVFPGLVALPYCTSFQRDKSQCNLWLSLPGNVGVLSVKIISICLKCCGQIPCHLELLGLKSVISTGFVRVFKDLNFRSSISRPCFEVLIFVFVVVFLLLKVFKCFTADHTTFWRIECKCRQ